MRRLFGTEGGYVASLVAGVLIAYVGLAISVSGRSKLEGVCVLLLGSWLALSAPVVHNQVHRERGELGHLLGWTFRHRPRW